MGGTYYVFSIPLNKGFIKNTHKAVGIYNKEPGISALNDINLKFRMTNNGIGLVISF